MFSTSIYRIKYRIKRLYDFIKLGWNDYDSYDSLLTLEKYKLSKMADMYEIIMEDVDEDFLNWQRSIKSLRLCVKLIDIVNGADVTYKVVYNPETNSYYKKRLKYVNMYNAHRFIPTKLQKLYDENENLQDAITNEVRRMKAWNLYGQIRALNINRW